VAHARYVVWWIMVYGWVIVPHLGAIADRWPHRIGWLDDRSVPSLRKAILAGALAILLLACSRPAVWLLFGVTPKAETRVTAVTPIHVLDRIAAIDAVNGPRPHVIFASETLGDYLLWDLGQHSFPEPVRLSCYTHVHLFTKEHWDQCLQVKNATRQWEQVLDRMGVDLLVLEDELYDQGQRIQEKKAPGFSNLIDRVREASDRWQVLSKPDDPIFLAQRRR
jgi:hypothetical protein